MSIFVHKQVDKRVQELKELEARAEAWRRTQPCRRCGLEFSFGIEDLKPGLGDYGALDFHAPYVCCPACGAEHLFWFGVFSNRWAYRYLKLLDDLKRHPQKEIPAELKAPELPAFKRIIEP